MRRKRLEEYIGERYGMLTVIGTTKLRGASGNTYVKCRCDCGVEKAILLYSLKRGDTKSCGCLQRATARKHLAQYYETHERSYKKVPHHINRGSQYTNVYWNKTKKRYQVRMRKDGKEYTKIFREIEQAILYRDELERKLYGSKEEQN